VLVPRQAADDLRLPVRRDVAAIGNVGCFEPAEVAEVFAQRRLPLDVDLSTRRLAGAARLVEKARCVAGDRPKALAVARCSRFSSIEDFPTPHGIRNSQRNLSG